MIKVLIVEDSQVIRDYLTFVLEQDPKIEVFGSTRSGEEALQFLQRKKPDIILMDIHLPGIDGFEATRRIMTTSPVPIVICTGSVNFDDVHTAMKTLDAGALVAIKKPRGFDDPRSEIEAAEIINMVKLMSEVKVVRRWPKKARAEVMPLEFGNSQIFPHEPAMIAIGASTGGPPALMSLLSLLPADFPIPILVVQHITIGFTQGFADWLASGTKLKVHIARNGINPLPGNVYVAPDDEHLEIDLNGQLLVTKKDRFNNLRPSVDVLFKSVAKKFGKHSVGILLSGMGKDGAEELGSMAQQGAITFAQNKESSVVFGMPGEAVRLNAARFVAPPKEIGEILLKMVNTNLNEAG